MALDRRLGETLGQIAVLLDDARETWWIIGSAAVALHGGDAGDIGDVDVLLGTGDAHRIVDRLGLNRLDCDGDSRFRSTIFPCWNDPPMKVEFMAELQVATAAGWVSVAPQTREIIRY